MKKSTKIALTAIGVAGLAIAATKIAKKYLDTEDFGEDLVSDDDDFTDEGLDEEYLEIKKPAKTTKAQKTHKAAKKNTKSPKTVKAVKN